MPLLSVQGLVKRFGAFEAVKGVSFDLDGGGVLGFLGPNGAGKTTTMRMISGFLPPSAGRALLCGHDVALEPLAAKQALGYLPEGAPLYGEMTPANLLDFVGRARGLPGEIRRRRSGEVAERLSLEPVLEQPIDTLSKGFKRRVGLAAALLHDPKVLVLDEPTDGLDPNQKQVVRAHLRELSADRAIIVSTHILEEVEAVCDRAILIAAGRLVADDTPEGLLSRSRYHGALSLVVPAAARAEAGRRLQGLEGSGGLEIADHGGEEVRLTLLAKPGASLLASVQAALADSGIRHHSLAIERGRLDDVFRDLTEAAA